MSGPATLPDQATALPGRVPSGVQLFEAHIDDQLLHVNAYRALLERHRFVDIESFPMSPMHTYGRAPRGLPA